MAIDYSTLNDEELKAIANNDYSKLSNATLEALANKPKSQQQRPVEGAGGAAFGVYRPQGRRPESQQDREAAKDMPLQTARGVVTGMLGAPSDLANLPGVLYSAATGQPQPYQVPLGSEQWNQMLPFQSDAPSAKLARLGGEVLAPFPTVKGLQTIPGAVRGVGNVAKGAFGRGFNYIAEPGATPGPIQVPSSRVPISSTYVDPAEFAAFQRGELPYGQLPQNRPIGELAQGPLDRAALAVSGGEIPLQGQAARAFGERIGKTYNNPVQAALDIGSLFLPGNPGIPILTAGRSALAGIQGLADMRLAGKGFSPEVPKTIAEYQSGARPMPGIPGPISPQFEAARKINPVGATPMAQAAINTATASTPIRPTAVASTPATPESTASIASALQNKVATNPALERYTKPYVVAEHLDEPINNFLNGWQRNALAYGPPGTGKTSLAYEWKAKNPQGTLEYLDASTFNKAEAQKLNNAYFTRETPTLYVIDEADKFSKAQQKDLKALMDATKQNGRVLATSNAPDKVPEFLKTSEFAQLDVNPRLTPEAKSTYALNVARDFDVNMTPAQIESIAQHPTMQSFRDIKREISKGYSKKESPMFPRDTGELASDIPSTGLAQLDDFVNNKSSKNVLIVDKQAFANDPKISEKLNKLTHITDLDSNNLTNMLASPTSMSDTVRVVIRDKTDAAKLSRLKGLIERNNESRYPTNIIVEDLHGKLDDAIISRGDPLNLTKLPSEQAAAAMKPKTRPPGVMEMTTAGPNDFMGDLQFAHIKQNYDDMPLGSHVEDGIRHEIVENKQYTNMPDDVKKLVPEMPKKIYRKIDVETGRVIQGPKNYADLMAEAAKILKQAKEGKKNQGK